MWGMWPIFKTSMNIDLAVAGIIVGASSFVTEILQIYFGGLSDRGYRFLILGCGLLFVNAFAFLPNFPPMLALLLLYFPVSLGSSAFHPPAAGIIGQYNPKARGFNMSLFWAFGATGLSLSQLVFSGMYAHYKDYFYLITIPGIVLACFAFYLYKKDTHTVAATTKKFKFSDLADLFKRRDTFFLWLSQVMIASIYWGTLFLLPDLLLDKGYPVWITSGTAHMFYVIGAAVTSIAAGWIADRTSPKLVMLVGTIIGFFCFYAMVTNDRLEPPLILGLCFSVGALLGQCSPLSIALGNALVPEKPALISSFLMGCVWFISEAIGTTGVGLTTKLFTEHQPTYALYCLGILFIPAIIALSLMPLKTKEWNSQSI